MLYTAIIIEPREHPALLYVLTNFLKNLSDDWGFIIYHGTANVEFIQNILINHLSEYIPRIKTIVINADNLTIEDYNNLLKYNKQFYECITTEMFLIFQTDSISFEINKHLIYNFMKYDYVGAPWGHMPLNGQTIGNGGLSLRKKSKMLEIMDAEGIKGIPEDVYFSCPNNVSLFKPSTEEAKLFSVEELFNDTSFGCHKPWNRYYQGQLYDIYQEVRDLYHFNNVRIPGPIVEEPHYEHAQTETEESELKHTDNTL